MPCFAACLDSFRYFVEINVCHGALNYIICLASITNDYYWFNEAKIKTDNNYYTYFKYATKYGIMQII